jgi:hypothetical protein
MRSSALAVAAALALAAPTVATRAAAGEPWLHVRVTEGKGSKVSVNLPFVVVEAALQAAPGILAEHGKIKIGSDKHKMKLADARQMWKAVKEAGDAEFVTVEEEDQNVRIARKGDTVEIRVDSKKKQGEQVHVLLPVALVDAALGGPSEELDLKAAIAELKRRRGDIVRVTDKEDTVRIWIDDQGPTS